MFVFVFRKLVPKGYEGISIFPFIFVKKLDDKNNFVLIQHEKIHIRQQLELLVLPFYIWYFIEFLIKFVLLKDKNKAYQSISFEKEAYANETKLNYLETRLFWGFLKYI